jgi:hypothetical protein
MHFGNRSTGDSHEVDVAVHRDNLVPAPRPPAQVGSFASPTSSLVAI